MDSHQLYRSARSQAAGQRLLCNLLFFTVICLFVAAPLLAAQSSETIPLDQIKPGMKGYASTIFAGDQIEKFNLEVIGVMDNFLGPKQSIILVELKGPKVEHTGVVAGMSGSPVYLEGKLAGALSLKLGIFTKEAIAGVTPIADLLSLQTSPGAAPNVSAETAASQPQLLLPSQVARNIGLSSSAYLQPIETPLVFSGFLPASQQRFSADFARYGMVATPGGTSPARPDDAKILPGDMVGMVLVQGDASINSACTVTALRDDRVYMCGHPLFGFGSISLPMARSRVLTTLSSELASTKIVNLGGSIGTITDDRLTAVVGRLGAAPPMVPMDLAVATPLGEKLLHFQLIQHPKITPLLVAITAFNGLVANSVYTEGTTLRLTGQISIAGHSPVRLENMFAPTDQFIPDGIFVATTVQNLFARIFSNPYEAAQIERISLRVEGLPERRGASIESAWLDKSEAAPGENLRVRVLLRPYRGVPIITEVPISIPSQASRGTTMRVLVSDADVVNRTVRPFSPLPANLAGLEQLITLLNRERRNDRLYVTLFGPTPTLFVEDKELPNAPLSQINVLEHRRTSGGAQLLRESASGEWSAAMKEVISGFTSLTITVK